jgi:hypothetical protein
VSPIAIYKDQGLADKVSTPTTSPWSNPARSAASIAPGPRRSYISLPPGTAPAAIAAPTRAGQQTASGTVITVAVTGIVVSDLLLAFVWCGSSNPTTPATITPPSGWTVLTDQNQASTRAITFYKLAGSGEPTSYSFTCSVTGLQRAVIVRIPNTANVVNYEVAQGAGVQNIPTPNVVNPTNNAHVIYAVGNDNGSAWNLPGTTELADIASGTGTGGRSLAVYTLPSSAPSTVVAGTATDTAALGSENWIAVSIVVARADAGPIQVTRTPGLVVSPRPGLYASKTIASGTLASLINSVYIPNGDLLTTGLGVRNEGPSAVTLTFNASINGTSNTQTQTIQPNSSVRFAITVTPGTFSGSSGGYTQTAASLVWSLSTSASIPPGTHLILTKATSVLGSLDIDDATTDPSYQNTASEPVMLLARNETALPIQNIRVAARLATIKIDLPVVEVSPDPAVVPWERADLNGVLITTNVVPVNGTVPFWIRHTLAAAREGDHQFLLQLSSEPV